MVCRVSVDSVHFVIGAYPPSIGGAQLHTAALVEALSRELSMRTRVSCLWRDTRHDWLWGSTVRLPSGRAAGEAGGAVVETVGLRGPRRRRDVLVAASYHAVPRRGAAYFARRLDYRDGDEALVHVVRLGREHLAVRALQEARSRGVPLVLTPNHHPRWSRRRPSGWLDLYHAADRVFALTRSERDELTRLGVPRDRITVTGIGPLLSDEVLPREEFLSSFGLRDGRFVGFLGQQFGYKRVDVVVQAFDLLAADDPDLRLLIAGPTAPATFEACEKASHRDRIRVLGPLTLLQKTSFLRHLDVLLFPSQQESFGGVLIEAASMGTPFVTSDIPPLAEVTAELRLGVTSSVEPSAFASAAAGFLRSPPAAEAVAAAAGRCERYSWSRLAAGYRDAYDAVAG